jgi:hypothetical protein
MIRSTLAIAALTWLGVLTLVATIPFTGVVIPIVTLVVAVAASGGWACIL